MICTNPDLIVDKGDRRELCAGSVAMVFEKMGGEVIYFGKPYPEVYNQSFDNTNKKTLSIGDNLNTDIKGANLLNYDSLLILNGVHKEEIKNSNIDNPVAIFFPIFKALENIASFGFKTGIVCCSTTASIAGPKAEQVNRMPLASIDFA